MMAKAYAGFTLAQMKSVAVNLVEQLTAANARIAELEGALHNIDEALPDAKKSLKTLIGRAEQAEAQAAAMRTRFEKYIRDNCKLIRHAVVDGEGYPDDVDGKCGGYCQSYDEPHETCQTCVAYAYPDESDDEPDAGSDMLARMERIRDATRRLIDESDRLYLANRDENIDLPHLAMAIELAKAALE